METPAKPKRPRREYLPSILCIGSPCLGAVITAAAFAAVGYFSPSASWVNALLWVTILPGAVLSAAGATAGSLLSHGALGGRVVRAVTRGIAGLVAYPILLLLIAFVVNRIAWLFMP